VAIAAGLLASGSDTSNVNQYTTASFTPGANRLVLLTLNGSTGSGVPPAPALVGNDLTYVLATAAAISASVYQFTYRAMGAAPSAGAVVITYGGAQTGTQWSVAEFTGVDTSGTNGSGAIRQTATATFVTAISMAATLSAFGAAGNATYGAFSSNTDGPSLGSGFTQVHHCQNASPTRRLLTEWRVDNDTTPDATCSTAGQMLGAGLELVAAADVTATVVPNPWHTLRQMVPA